ncbi:unnamed protein product [Malus baccata var. baccata]
MWFRVFFWGGGRIKYYLMSQLIKQRRSVSRSLPTPPPPTPTVATAPPALAPTSKAILHPPQAPMSTMLESSTSSDVGLRIMTNTINQKLCLMRGKVYQGMGNASHYEMGASSSTSTSGQVASLTEQVYIVTQTTHIATQHAHIAAQESRMAQIITALMRGGFDIPSTTPHTITPSTSQALDPAQPTAEANSDDFLL